jgi:alternate signal-mediated exported protein
MSSNAETTRSRSKLTKALVATGVGVALLAGGGGTFAAWSDQAEVTTGTRISSGELRLEAVEAGTWMNVKGHAVTSQALADGTYKIVPGDALTYTQTINLHAAGDLLVGTLSTNLDSLVINDVSGQGGLAERLKKAATLTVDDKVQTGLEATITPTGGIQKAVVAVTIAFDEQTADLLAQNTTVSLSNLEILLTQTPIDPAPGATSQG